MLDTTDYLLEKPNYIGAGIAFPFPHPVKSQLPEELHQVYFYILLHLKPLILLGLFMQ